MLDTGYWILDAGYWILDTGYWILDTGCWILDAGYWILDAGYGKAYGYAGLSSIQHPISSIIPSTEYRMPKEMASLY
jgi:hypothetical protein